MLDDIDELGDARDRGFEDETDRAREGGGDGFVTLAFGVDCTTFIVYGCSLGNSDRLGWRSVALRRGGGGAGALEVTGDGMPACRSAERSSSIEVDAA